MKTKRRLTLVSGGLALTALLSACFPPPNDPPVNLHFSFPDTTTNTKLRLAALYFEGSTVKVITNYPYLSNASSSADYSTVNQGVMSFYSRELNALARNAACTTPFVGGETQDMQDVTVTPSTVKTCNIYFSLYLDADGNGLPSRSEELYLTHDIYSYATSAFTYSFTSPDGKSKESGSRQAGWSLVRHQVLQPSATPGKYLVSMDSVPTADEAISIRLHAPTDRLTSQGLRGTK